MKTRITGGNVKCEDNQEEEQGRAVVLQANRTTCVQSEQNEDETSQYSTVGHKKKCRQLLWMSGMGLCEKSQRHD